MEGFIGFIFLAALVIGVLVITMTFWRWLLMWLHGADQILAELKTLNGHTTDLYNLTLAIRQEELADRTVRTLPREENHTHVPVD